MNNSIFASLATVEVYFEYDGPRMFTAKSEDGRMFLANMVEESVEKQLELYLYVEISDERIELVHNNEMDLRDVYMYPEDDIVYKVTIEYGQDAITHKVEQMETDSLPHEWLPQPGVKLDIVQENTSNN